MGSSDLQFWTRIGAMNRFSVVPLIANELQVRFLESPLFLSDLLTGHDRVRWFRWLSTVCERGSWVGKTSDF